MTLERITLWIRIGKYDIIAVLMRVQMLTIFFRISDSVISSICFSVLKIHVTYTLGALHRISAEIAFKIIYFSSSTRPNPHRNSFRLLRVRPPIRTRRLSLTDGPIYIRTIYVIVYMRTRVPPPDGFAQTR